MRLPNIGVLAHVASPHPSLLPEGEGAISAVPWFAEARGMIQNGNLWPGKAAMQITITIDDALYQDALELAAPDIDEADLLREALQTFVRVQAGKRLLALGGSLPEMQDIPRQ